jgi:hypothetical protein
MKFNGNIELLAGGAGKVLNAHIESGASNPSGQSSNNAGRLHFNTTDHLFYFYNGTSWVTFATGGNAATLQAEVDAIEATLGSLVNTDGTTNVAAALTNSYFGGATDLTNALINLASAVTGHDQLSELLDVTISTATNKDLLQYISADGKWENKAIGSVSGVQAWDADLDTIAAFTHTAGHIIYDTGTAWAVAGPGATAGVQAWDAGLDALAAAGTGIVSMNGDTVAFRTLTAPSEGITISNADGVAGNPTFALANDLGALEALTTTGFSSRTGTSTWATRSLVAPSAGITISNPAGIAGDPTFALANDLAALEGLTTTGYIVRTGDGTATTRSLAVVTGELVITGDAAGVSTDTTFGLATVTDAGTGSFLKFTRDTFGRVSGTTAVVTADITALVDATYVNVSGDTMNGSLTFSSGTVTGLPSPTNASDAANKAYVDAAAAGLNVHGAVEAATTANLTATYANGTAGVGATLTNSGTQAAFQVDGYTGAIVGTRILVKNQTTATQNGIYTVTTVGSGSVNWVLTRATDADNHLAGQVGPGDYVFVAEGSTQASTSWTETAIGTGTGDAIVIGTDNVHYTQFSGAGTYLAGTGLTLTGNTFTANLGAGIAELPTGEIGLDLYTPSAGALILTTNGTVRSTASASLLHLLLPSGSGLTQDATGLYVPVNGITNSMIVNDTWTLNGDASTVAADLGDTFEIKGNSTQGILTSVAKVGTVDTFTVTASTATSSQLGVAKFNTGDFDVTAGDVTIKAAGVDNVQLVNSTITVTGSTGSDPVALGESFAIIGGSTPITTVSAANSVTISVANATTSTLGLASFNSAQFSVTAGAVDLTATLSDLTDVDTSTDAPTLHDVLSWTGSTWAAVDPSVALAAAVISDLADVATSSPVNNDALIWDGTNWVNQKIFHTEAFTSSSTWVVTHGIGQRWCNVTVIDTATNEVVIPQAIVFDSTTQLTVTFNASLAGQVVVMGVA